MNLKKYVGERLITEGIIELKLFRFWNNELPFVFIPLLWIDDLRNTIGWFIIANLKKNK